MRLTDSSTPRRNRRRCGFTLAESLLAALLLALASGGMAAGVAFAASFIFMLPPLLIFLYGEQYLVEGISRSGIK